MTDLALAFAVAAAAAPAAGARTDGGTAPWTAPAAPALPGDSSPPQPAAASGQAATEAQVKSAVADANRHLVDQGTELTFVFDDKLNRAIVRIVDRQTNKVVRQIPSEAMLATARALAESGAHGALINTSA